MVMIKLKHLLLAVALTCPLALAACGGDGADDTGGTAGAGTTIRLSQDELAAPAEGGSYTVGVSQTGREWTAYSDNDWLQVSVSGSTSASGMVTIVVGANSTTAARTGAVFVKSGTVRQTLTVTQAGVELPPADTTIKAPEGYELVWHDEFDEGTQLDGSYWEWENWERGRVNDEQQYYRPGTQTIDGRHTTELVDGQLVISCFKGSDGRIYSGRVNAKNGGRGWQYGWFEARMLLPKGKGTWPAFWMMPITVDWQNEGWPRCGEIDIMEEVGCVPNEVSSSLHAEGHNHTNGTQVTKARNIGSAESEYHVYALEWTADYIRTYVDGEVLLTYTSDHTVRNFPYDKPFHLILNLAWGGSWGGMWGTDESALPVQMKVDYVRVFQKK